MVLLHGLLTIPVVQLHRETHGAVSATDRCVPPSPPPPELSNLRYLWLASPFLILCLTEGPGPHFSHTFTTLLAVSEMEKLHSRPWDQSVWKHTVFKVQEGWSHRSQESRKEMTGKPNTSPCLMSPKIILVTTQSFMPSPLLMEESAHVHSVLLD